jgi:hypothetical protein
MQQDSSIGDMILLVNRKCIDVCLIESRSAVLISTEIKAQWETEIAAMQDTIAQAIVARDERRAAKDAVEAPSVGRKKHRARVDAVLAAAERESRQEMSKKLKHPELITEARVMAADSREAAMERAEAEGGEGRHAGVVKGGSGKTARALLQPGNVVKAAWRGRLDSHIGTYGIEPVHPYAAVAMSTPAVLSGLSALCAMVETALPEPKAKAVKKPAAKKAEAPAAEAEAEAKPAKTPRAKKTDE